MHRNNHINDGGRILAVESSQRIRERAHSALMRNAKRRKVQVAESSIDRDLYHVASADNDSIENHSRWVLIMILLRIILDEC